MPHCIERLWETPVSHVQQLGLISLAFDADSRSLSAVLCDLTVGKEPVEPLGNAELDKIFGSSRPLYPGDERWSVHFRHTYGIKLSDDFFDGEDKFRVFSGWAPTTVLFGANWLAEFKAICEANEIDRVYTIYCDPTIQVISACEPRFVRIDH